MIITNIELKNWKNFGEVSVDCAQRMFLIGPNASGKSNFLDALRFLCDVSRDGLDKAVTEHRGGMKSIRWLGARRTPDITIRVTMDHVWCYSLTFGTKRGAQRPLVVNETVWRREDDDPERPWGGILDRPDRDDQLDPQRLSQTALQQVNANKPFRELAEFFASIQYRHILPQLVREPKNFSSKPIYDDPYGRDLVSQIWKTPVQTRGARLRKINAALQAAVPNLQDLTVEQDSDGLPHLRVKYEHWRAQGAYQDEARFSDGTLRLLALLWTLLDTGGPLLLEEPELSLHEDIVALLPTLFARMDRNRKKAARQVFITTHAKALLKDPGVGAEEVLLFIPGGEGTTVTPPDEKDASLLIQGRLTAADVLLPKTRPAGVEQLGSF